MALFDSIISGASEKFGLGDKAGTMLSALLALMTNQETGGFSGFLDRFKEAGLGDTATSWITSGDNAEVSSEQIESAIGSDTIATIAEQVGVDKDKATAALAYMTPKVVDDLTPDGEIPDDEGLMSRIGGFLSGIGGTAAGVVAGAAGLAGAAASGAADKAGDAVDAVGDVAGAAKDKVGDAAGATVDAGKAAVGAVGDTAGAAVDAVGDAAGAAKDKVGDAFESVGDVFDGDGDGGGVLKWLLPLLLLGVLLVLGFMFCGGNKDGKTTTPPKDNTNTNAKAGDTADVLESSVNIEAKDGKYSITGVVADEKTKADILAEAEKTWGKGNVNVDGLKVDAKAKPFKDGWFDGFKGLLPDLKDWKDGSIGWAGEAIKTVGEIPGAISDKLKSLFGGWSLGGAADAAKDAVKNTADAATDAARKLASVALSDEVKLDAYPGGIEEQLITFIKSDEYKNATDADLKSKWFDFDDLNFEFGKTTLVPESKRQLDNIVAILKAYPEVKMKIGGYTDKKGNDAANKALSQKRADAVKAALAKAGVGDQVPEAEGYGEQRAKVAEDASDKEREADRKTSVRLVKSGDAPVEDAAAKE